MEIKNPLSRKKKVPQFQHTKESKTPKQKKDWFGSALIAYTGIMIGALIVYLLIEFT